MNAYLINLQAYSMPDIAPLKSKDFCFFLLSRSGDFTGASCQHPEELDAGTILKQTGGDLPDVDTMIYLNNDSSSRSGCRNECSVTVFFPLTERIPWRTQQG
jgi:hypothetical protein